MIELLVAALFQAVVGAPAPGPEQRPTEAPATTSEVPGVAAPPAASPEEAVPPTVTQYRRERRCESVEVTGRRMPQRVCRNVMVPVEQPAPAANP
jgi:hypothetical protein